MANLIDASILSKFRGPDIGRTFSNILTNVERIDRLKQGRTDAPLQSQLLQQRVDTGQQQASQARADQRMRSVAIGSAEVLPFLQKGDIEGARSTLLKRRQQLIDQGLPTETTDEGLALLDSNPQLLAQRAQQSVELGQRLGVFSGQQGQTAGQREFTSLVKSAELSPKETRKAARVKLGLDARASNFAERLQFEIDKAKGAGDVKVEQDLRKTAGNLGIKLRLDPQIAAKTDEAKLPALQRRETIKANTQRIKFLSGDQRKRDSSVRKARQFLAPLKEGRAFSGAGRSASLFIPGVFTSQGVFDEKFNAFAEIAARQQLKASGETRPTDADVEGMKRAMFGVGRDEQTNVQLLQEFIEDQEALNDELEDLTQSRSSGTLDTFDIQKQRTQATPESQVIRFDAQGNIIQ